MLFVNQYLKNIFCTLIISILLLTAGCKKWVDVNYDPTQLTETNAKPSLVLAGALENQALGFIGFKHEFAYRWMGYWCPAYVQASSDEQTYNLTPSSPALVNNNSSGIRTFRFIENKGKATGQTFYVGIAKVMKAMIFAEDVDVFNNIPYRQSGDPTNFQYPEYESAQFIYEDIMRVLDTAIVLIKNADIGKNEGIANADVMFHADKNSWVKFANTLKLRLLVHQACRTDRANYIQTEIAKIIAEGSGFLNSGENAAVNPGYTETKANGAYEVYAFMGGGYPGVLNEVGRANVIAMDFLKQNNDPRLGFFYASPAVSLPPGATEPFVQPPPGDYRGNQYGLQYNPALYPYQSSPYISRIGGLTVHGPVTFSSSGILKGYDMDAWILTSVESLFLQAEAIYRGWLPGDKKQAYLDAVQESFRWLNAGGDMNDPSVSDAVFNNWYATETNSANVSVSWDHASDKYKLLMFQKYLAMNGLNALETWTDYRRNGAYPDIPLSADPGRTSFTLPVRLPYPSKEYENNYKHVAAQGDINVFTSKIWWMP